VEGTTTTVTAGYFANNMRIAQRKSVYENSVLSSEELLYIHTDHLGSAVRMTDESGNVVSSLAYSPYGETIYAAGDEDTSYQFTGQHNDGNGIYYFHARYYDPVLGRFLQADSVLDGLNRYAYCHNNPVVYTDPTGEFFFTAILSAFGPVGTVIGAVIDSACWGATIAGGLNAGVQAVNIITDNQSDWDWDSFGAALITGAVGGSFSPVPGALTAAETSLVGDIFIGATMGAIGGGIDYTLKAQFGFVEWDSDDFLANVGMGALIGGAMGALSHLNTDVRNSLNQEPTAEEGIPARLDSKGNFKEAKDGWYRMPLKESEYHQFRGFGSDGVPVVEKFVRDGSETCWYKMGSEWVKVTNVGMRGTYNFIPYTGTIKSAVGHFFTDMVPFYMFDSISYATRPFAPVP
jgi:RHS repeat-associated protein